MAKRKMVSCECGLQMSAPAEKDAWLVELVQMHSEKHHKMERPRPEDVKKMMKDA